MPLSIGTGESCTSRNTVVEEDAYISIQACGEEEQESTVRSTGEGALAKESRCIPVSMGLLLTSSSLLHQELEIVGFI